MQTSTPEYARPRRGSALLAVLWLAAGLAAIGFAVASIVRAETGRVDTETGGLRAQFLATGSVERAILWMLWGARGFALPDGRPRFYQAPMPYLRFPYPSGEALVEVIPETARLNLNLAAPQDLSRVLLAVGADPEQARQITLAILDWRSPAGAPTLFDQFYLQRVPSFRSRHASFEEIEELLLLRGMTPELFHGGYREDNQGRLYPTGGLKDCLSVYGAVDAFDLNTAAPPLLLAMGMAPQAVEALVRRRIAQPFRSEAEAVVFTQGNPRFRIGGNTIWTLRATARLRLADGTWSSQTRTAAATVKLLDPQRWNPPYHVLRWYEDAWSQTAPVPFSTGAGAAPAASAGAGALAAGGPAR